MFSRFDRVPACDGRTDVKPIAITCFSIADARKNKPIQAMHFGKFQRNYFIFSVYAAGSDGVLDDIILGFNRPSKIPKDTFNSPFNCLGSQVLGLNTCPWDLAITAMSMTCFRAMAAALRVICWSYFSLLKFTQFRITSAQYGQVLGLDTCILDSIIITGSRTYIFKYNN